MMPLFYHVLINLRVYLTRFVYENSIKLLTFYILLYGIHLWSFNDFFSLITIL